MSQQIDIVANLLMKVDGAEAGLNKLRNSLSKLKMPEGLENSFKKSFSICFKKLYISWNNISRR